MVRKNKAQKRTKNDVSPGSQQEGVEALAIGLDSRTNNLCDLVFGIDLLREMIIAYVIHDNDSERDFSKPDALSCRLVQKSWLESVFRCLIKSQKPLVKFGIGYGHRKLEPFPKICMPPSRLPMKLAVDFKPGSFEWDLRVLEKYLHFCGDSLVELDLRFFLEYAFPQTTKKLLRDFTKKNFTLPMLQKLSYSIIRGFSNTNVVNFNMDISSIPQSILSGCVRLKYFKFYDGFFRAEPLPASFGNLILPPTITNLVLDCQIRTNHLEPLLKHNMFPNLMDLTVVVPKIIYEEKEWIYVLLNQVRFTLKHLNIRGEWYYPEPQNRVKAEKMIKIDPPVMKSLKKIFIDTHTFEWTDGITNLHRKLPALKNIHLYYVTSTNLKKWTQDSMFSALTEVSLEFCDHTAITQGEFFTVEDARVMSEAFPNVKKLTISASWIGSVCQALQCLFHNMTQLQVLTLQLRSLDEEDHPRYLDALLLGVSCELIETLKTECARGKLWEAVQIRMDKQFSISNLSELRELSLDFDSFSEDPTFVSDKVKKFVVSTIPGLQKIDLPQPTPYLYTQAQIRKWKQSGRIFNWGSSGPRRLRRENLGAE